MNFLSKLNKRAEEQEEHDKVEQRLTLQERKVRLHEIRLKRLELELGIVVAPHNGEHNAT